MSDASKPAEGEPEAQQLDWLSECSCSPAHRTPVTNYYYDNRKPQQCDAWLCKRRASKTVKGTGKRVHNACAVCCEKTRAGEAVTFEDGRGWAIGYAAGVATAI